MKKNQHFPDHERSGIKKLLIVMKLTTIFLFLSAMAMAASTFSQNARFDLTVKDASIIQVFDEIERVSDYGFLFKTDQLDLNRKYTLDLKNANIEKVLQAVLDQNEFTYNFIDRNIVISRIESQTSQDNKVNKVSGKVTDSSGSPLPGVSVVVKGTTTGAITDGDGNYSLTNVPGNATLLFSFVGMKTQEVSVGTKTTINVVLVEETIGIDEVVAVGYGTQKKSDLTGSVGTVKSSDFLKTPLTQAGQALQGRIAGVQVTIPGGKPGEDTPNVTIRGIGSFGSASNPLVLVDGLESSFNAVAPNDIDKITVLKDAAACSIYGARAANGVILIETKTGSDKPATIEYDGYYGFQKTLNLYEMCNAEELATLQNEARINGGFTPFWTGVNTPETLGEGTNWIDEVFRTAPMMNHHLSITGGNKMSNYAILGGYLNQDGVMHGTDYKRYNFRINVTTKVRDFIKIGANLNVIRGEQNSSTGYSSWQDNAWVGALRATPMIPVYNPDGSWGTPRPISEYPGEWYSLENPVALLHLYTNETRTSQFSGLAFAEIDLIKGLSLKSTFGVDFFTENYDFFQPTYEFKIRGTEQVYRSSTKAQAISSNSTSLKWSNENILTFRKEKGPHRFEIMGGQTTQGYRIDNISGQKLDFADNNIKELNAGVEIVSLGGGASEWALMSFLGRVNYSLLDRYLFQMNIRHDGSSRLAPENRWKTFPSFSAGWRVSEEGFWPENELVGSLKIRGSWGKLGNQEIGLYPYISNLNVAQNYVLGSETKVQGVAPTSIANRDIRWEVVTMSNIGMDVSFGKGQFNIETDFFKKKTSDILQRPPIPASVGISGTPYQNIGELLNTGIEIAANYSKQIGDLKFSVNANASYIENEITKLANSNQDIISGITITKVGQPMNSLYGYVFDGIFQNNEEVSNHVFQEKTTSPGDIRFKNLNGDDKIDANDRTTIGHTIPKFYYGGSVNLEYKRIDFGIFFQGIGNRDVYMAANNFGRDIRFMNERNVPKELLNRWTGEGSSLDYPRVIWRDPSNNARTSDRWIENGRYFRIKTINLGYSLPDNWIKSVKLSSARIYLTAQNFITFTSFKGMEPETTSYDPQNRTYPQPSTILIGFNVKF